MLGSGPQLLMLILYMEGNHNIILKFYTLDSGRHNSQSRQYEKILPSAKFQIKKYFLIDWNYCTC